jgi:hypothetical protein
MDLGVNSGKAAAVEQWFDDLTEWDEKAEATAAGKITELLVNIGVPGGVAFRHGTKLANAAMQAFVFERFIVSYKRKGRNVMCGVSYKSTAATRERSRAMNETLKDDDPDTETFSSPATTVGRGRGALRLGVALGRGRRRTTGGRRGRI